MILPVQSDSETHKSPIPPELAAVGVVNPKRTFKDGVGLAELTDWRAFRILTQTNVALASSISAAEQLTIGGIQATGDQILARLTNSDYLLLNKDSNADPLKAIQLASGSNLTTISDASHGLARLLIAGSRARSLLSHLCGLDLREAHFPNLRAAQTSLARVHGTILRYDWQGYLAFLLLVDRSVARYLWQRIHEVGSEAQLAIIEAGGYPDQEAGKDLPKGK